MTKVVVMGVAGSGKTTVGRRLAARIGAEFVDADDLHPPANIAKMTAGIPLLDEDRRPWLERVRDALGEHEDVVVACSALRVSHRAVLREAGRLTFVFLDLDESAAERRARQRRGHFMGADMIASQFATLERPTADETDVVVVDVDRPHTVVLADVLARVTG